jgi:acetyl esterase/lipase
MYTIELYNSVLPPQMEDAMFDGVPVRVYTPVDSMHNGSGLMFFHGGGWIVGNIGKDGFISSPYPI